MPFKKGHKLPKAAEPFKFKPGQSGNPAGRPPDLIPNALKKLTAQQIRRIIKATVKGNIPELRRIAKDDKSSGLEVAMASCLMTAIKKGDYDTIEKMLVRTGVIAKEPEKIVVESKNINTNTNLDAAMAAVTDEELAARLKRIRESVG
jgi:hypothetical protein